MIDYGMFLLVCDLLLNKRRRETEVSRKRGVAGGARPQKTGGQKNGREPHLVFARGGNISCIVTGGEEKRKVNGVRQR